MRLTSRRRFLFMAIGAGSSLGIGAATWLASSGDSSAPVSGSVPFVARGGLEAVARTSWVFGSKVSMTALDTRREVAQEAVAAAMAELELVEELMSLYRPQSQLCRLNRHAVLDDPHPHLVEVLQVATAMSRRTGGAFDVTVQPLWTVYAEAAKAGRAPDEKAILAALKRVDWRRVEIASRRIRLHGDGTAVTLNGIAQGFAADRAMAALRRHGIQHALVDTGEIGTLGGKSGSESWRVGIQHPRREDAYVSLAELSGRCLATSGDYATRFSRDHRDHHIFSPHNGRSPQALSSVSVAARTAVEADALSTAAFVLGVEKGLELVRSTPAADALFVLEDGSMLATQGFPAGV